MGVISTQLAPENHHYKVRLECLKHRGSMFKTFDPDVLNIRGQSCLLFCRSELNKHPFPTLRLACF